MRQLTIAAATVAIAAMISAAPASAEYLGGAPRQQHGQCWKGSKGSEGFGYWRACPQPASARGPKRINPVTGQPESDTRSGGSAYSGG
jgi:hypothetical protein